MSAQAAYTHTGRKLVGWYESVEYERSKSTHAANFSHGQYGYDYLALCGERLHDDRIDRDEAGKSAPGRVTCKRCLRKILRASGQAEKCRQGEHAYEQVTVRRGPYLMGTRRERCVNCRAERAR